MRGRFARSRPEKREVLYECAQKAGVVAFAVVVSGFALNVGAQDMRSACSPGSPGGFPKGALQIGG
jgi:hypothetical protein